MKTQRGLGAVPRRTTGPETLTAVAGSNRQRSRAGRIAGAQAWIDIGGSAVPGDGKSIGKRFWKRFWKRIENWSGE